MQHIGVKTFLILQSKCCLQIPASDMMHNGVKKNWNRNKVLVTQVLGQNIQKTCDLSARARISLFSLISIMNYLFLDFSQYAAQWGQRILKLRSYFLSPHSTYREVFSILLNNLKITNCHKLFG